MKKFILLFIILFLSIDFVEAQNLYMTAKGSSQGVIEGESIQRYHEKQIEVLGYEYEVNTPRDASSGAASGKRTKSAFAIIKKFDVSSLGFYKAWMNNEILPTVTLEVYVPNTIGSSNSGPQVLGLKIELMNASVTSYKQSLPDDNQHGTYPKPVDTIKFSYRSIRITHVVKNVVVEDPGIISQ